MSNTNPSKLHEYVRQLNADIHECANNVDWPYLNIEEISLDDWKTEEEEDATAPVRNLTAWTGKGQRMALWLFRILSARYPFEGVYARRILSL